MKRIGSRVNVEKEKAKSFEETNIAKRKAARAIELATKRSLNRLSPELPEQRSRSVDPEDHFLGFEPVPDVFVNAVATTSQAAPIQRPVRQETLPELFTCRLHLHNQEMAYVSYSRNAQLHEMMSWYNVRELTSTLKAMRKLNFSIVEHRAQALQSLNALDEDAPFSRVERFPEGRLYISEAHGDWIRKFQQIRTSLAIKDHSKDKKTSATGTGDAADMNDALLAFYNAISGLFTQLAQREFLFDRVKFEEHYGCVWGNQAP